MRPHLNYGVENEIDSGTIPAVSRFTGDWFGYNASGQLTDVKYDAEQVNTGTPLNPARAVSYIIAQLPSTRNKRVCL